MPVHALPVAGGKSNLHQRKPNMKFQDGQNTLFVNADYESQLMNTAKRMGMSPLANQGAGIIHNSSGGPLSPNSASSKKSHGLEGS